MSTTLTFPTGIASPAWPFTCEYEDTSIFSKFEDGSMQSRSKFTRSRRKFTAKWNNIERADYVKIMNFIVNSAKFAANSFTWTNPDNLTETIEVRCTSCGEWSNDALNLWTGELELTEV